MFLHISLSQPYLCRNTRTKAGRIEYEMNLRPLYLWPEVIHTCRGAIINEDNTHWVALRSVGGKIWFLDSRQAPMVFSNEQYLKYINKRRGAYPILSAGEQMVSLSQSSSSDSSVILPICRNDSMESSSQGGATITKRKHAILETCVEDLTTNEKRSRSEHDASMF